MDSQKLIDQTASKIKQQFQGEGSGHDWWHIFRVWQMSKNLQKSEGGDLLIIELAALLHDIADWKFAGGDDLAGGKAAREWLESISAPEAVIVHVCDIIDHISYKGANVPTPMSSIEGKIVQDSDRLDAMGAIGIARAFAYGGTKARPLHDPEADYSLHQTAESYKAGDKATIHHFYDKLLLLKDRINTAAAREIAEHRHQFLVDYLKEFHAEWNSEK